MRERIQKREAGRRQDIEKRRGKIGRGTLGREAAIVSASLEKRGRNLLEREVASDCTEKDTHFTNSMTASWMDA